MLEQQFVQAAPHVSTAPHPAALPVVLLAWLLCLCAPALAQEPKVVSSPEDDAEAALAVGADPALAARLQELARTEAVWREHHEQEIVVHRIEGLHGSAEQEGGLALLKARLSTLERKKFSNREWYDYWDNERRLSTANLAHYDALAPSGKSGLLDAEITRIEAILTERRAAAAKAQAGADAEAAGFDKLSEAVGVQRAALATELAARRATQTDAARAVAAAAAVQKLAKTVAAEAATPDAGRALELAKDADSAARAAEAQLQAADAAVAQVDAQLALIDRALAGAQIDVAGLAGAGAAKSAVEALVAGAATPRAASTRLAAATANVEVAVARLAELRRDATNLRARRAALKTWQAVAADKLVNQDRYHAALTTDIEAVEERLRAFQEEPEGGLARADEVCASRVSGDDSPYSGWKACQDAIEGEIRHRTEARAQAGASEALTNTQLESIELLLTAQRVDISLVDREHAAASAESLRAIRSTEETDEWRTIWAAYRDRAAGKTGTLRDAVRRSNTTKRVLNGNLRLYQAEQATLLGQTSDLKDSLAAQDTWRTKASVFLQTLWHYLVTAWFVPLYIFAAWLVLLLVRRVAKRVVDNANEDDGVHVDTVQRVETLAAVGKGAAKLVVYVATLLLILSAVGVDIAPLLGGAAIFGLAISFGSQSLVKDVVTGFFILLEDQYAVGDVVTLGGETGTVEKITLRRTVMRDMSGRVHSVPNGSIGATVNQTQGWARVVLHVGVGYEADLHEVGAVIDRVGDEMFADPEWNTKITEPPRYVGVTSLGDSAVTARVMCKTEIFENWGVERELTLRLKLAFDAAGISIPYPQTELTLKNPAALAPTS